MDDVADVLHTRLYKIQEILEAMLEVQKLRAKAEIISTDWDVECLLEELSKIRPDAESGKT